MWHGGTPGSNPVTRRLRGALLASQSGNRRKGLSHTRRFRAPCPVDAQPAWDTAAPRGRPAALATELPAQLRRSQPREPTKNATGSASVAAWLRQTGTTDTPVPSRSPAALPPPKSGEPHAAGRPPPQPRGPVTADGGTAPASPVQLPALLKGSTSSVKAKKRKQEPAQVGIVPVTNRVAAAMQHADLRSAAAADKATAADKSGAQSPRNAAPKPKPKAKKGEVKSVVTSKRDGVTRAHDAWLRQVLSEDFDDAPPVQLGDADVGYLSSTFNLQLSKPLGQKTWMRKSRQQDDGD